MTSEPRENKKGGRNGYSGQILWDGSRNKTLICVYFFGKVNLIGHIDHALGKILEESLEEGFSIFKQKKKTRHRQKQETYLYIEVFSWVGVVYIGAYSVPMLVSSKETTASRRFVPITAIATERSFAPTARYIENEGSTLAKVSRNPEAYSERIT